jgi:hypothetical protein
MSRISHVSSIERLRRGSAVADLLDDPDLRGAIFRLPDHLRIPIIDEIVKASPATPQSPKEQLAALIPIAYDGDLITSAYHNTLRDALLKLAEQVGGGATGARVQTLSFAPAFLPVYSDRDGVLTKSREWVPLTGYVVRPKADDDQPVGCDGWMPVKLPEGYRIEGMTLIGLRNKGTTFNGNGFQVMLQSQKLDDSATDLLFTRSVSDNEGGDHPFSLPAVKQMLDDKLVVREDAFKYLVRATLTSASVDAVVALYGVKIKCVAV